MLTRERCPLEASSECVMNIENTLSRELLWHLNSFSTVSEEKKTRHYAKWKILGSLWWWEWWRTGTYLLEMPLARGTEQGSFLLAPLGRSVTVQNPNQTTWRERFIRCQIRCLISTESTRGEYFEILFHSCNSHSLYLYIPIGFRSHEANMECNELYTYRKTRAASQGVSF